MEAGEWMSVALANSLDGIDKMILSVAALALVAIVHAAAYTFAEGSLRPQRLLLRRGADLLALAAVGFIAQLWIP